MAPASRNQRSKKKKKKVAGPPAGAVRAAKENTATTSASSAQASEVANKESTPAEIIDDVSSPATTLAEDKDTPMKGARKRAANMEAVDANAEDDSQLVFEDPYGDEFESDGEVVGEDGKPLPAISADKVMLANDKMVFRPGVDKLNEGESLVYDESAYDTFHRVQVEWPSLSIDVIGTAADGSYSNMKSVVQDTYPLNCTVVLGSQASELNKNKLVFLRMTNLHRTRGRRSRGKNSTLKIANDSSDSDESDDEEDDDVVPINEEGAIQSAEIKHDSTVNRIRVMPQKSNIVAVWGESGRVSLIDATPALDVLNRDNLNRMSASRSIPPSAVKPFYSFAGHRIEGYALDWSRVTEGRLLSGSCNGSIYLWEPSSREASGWNVSADRFRGHRGSVEDIQWSPNEANVFASCGVDKSVRFWDTRNYRKPVLSIGQAHSTDVNVISWNRSEPHLLVSGGDDGVIRVWDLRLLKENSTNEGIEPAAEFKQHTKAITSVQWHPKDASMLCASSEDGSVTVWDLAVERDAEEELREGVVVAGAEDFPPQLLFIHMGQKNVKEAQWHPSCTSLLVTTAEDGVNIFKPSNITLPD